jgi:hypothetical protein
MLGLYVQSVDYSTVYVPENLLIYVGECMFTPNEDFYAIALDNPSVLDITVALQNVY